MNEFTSSPPGMPLASDGFRPVAGEEWGEDETEGRIGEWEGGTDDVDVTPDVFLAGNFLIKLAFLLIDDKGLKMVSTWEEAMQSC